MIWRVISEINKTRALFGAGAVSAIVGYLAVNVDVSQVDRALSNWEIQPIQHWKFWENTHWEPVAATEPSAVVASQKVSTTVVVGRKAGYPSVDTVANILATRNSKFSRIKARRLAHDILGLCQRYGFTPGFILGLIHVESNFDPKIESFAGAVGLMQIKPSTGKAVAERLKMKWRGRATLENPHHNLQIGMAYLHELRERLPHRIQYVTAYNWGPTRIERFVRGKRRLPLDYYKKVIRFGKRYAHLDQRP